ncbi:hypothetical protein T492DRAFT_906999 [Pavlovales sp. CCMP2436]|nr:hypothetical protein T492DRAFT_906999 [Pavlovales sp. CCMP2436]
MHNQQKKRKTQRFASCLNTHSSTRRRLKCKSQCNVVYISIYIYIYINVSLHEAISLKSLSAVYPADSFAQVRTHLHKTK